MSKERFQLPRLHGVWRQVSSTAIVVLAFAVLTLVVTYPVIKQLGSSLAGNPYWSYDAFQQTYEIWWFKKALMDLHTNPGNLGQLYFPTGANYPLLLTYFTTYVVGVPLSFFLSPVATYNVVLLLTFFFSGLSGYALSAYLTHNRWAGVLGGIVYAFFPSRMAHALSGHLELVSTYLFPLYILLLIKTVRRPRLVTALLCGLTLAGSLLVQPLFIPFLLIPITLIWLLYEAFLLHQRIERRALFAIASAFGIAVLITAPLFWPVLREQVQGRGTYLKDTGFVNYSADLLGIITPSPLNPVLSTLGFMPSYVHRVMPNWHTSEALVYAGVIPLALATIAALRQWRKLGAWILVALVAAVLSLGPVLKAYGAIVTLTVDDLRVPIALPYALLANLPFLSLNRAPARINTTFMLALAVLSSQGLAWLMARIRQGWKYIASVILYMVTVGEFLVIWPYPTMPLQVPDYLSDIAESANQGAVLNLPVASGRVKQTAIFYQTIHKHPVFDSWDQRSLPAFPNMADFLDGLLHPQMEEDIIPMPDVGALAAIARAEGVGYVFLFTPYVGDINADMQLLETEFGPPRSFEERIAIYEVTPGPTTVDDLVYALSNERWHQAETWNGRPARWISESAELYIYSPHQQEGSLQFTALPFATPERLQVEVNQAALSPLVISQWMTYTTPGFSLQPGINQITLRALDGCSHFVGDPRCGGVALAVIHDRESECSYYLHSERCLSVLFQNIRFVTGSAAPASHPVDVALGDQVGFLGYDLSGYPAPDQYLSLTLYWQALHPMKEDYTIFVHLLGPDRDLLTQYDALPIKGVYPTSHWIVGDIFTQQIHLYLPLDTQPGVYDLLVGMYTYPDTVRLPVASDRPYAQDGVIWLQSVEVQ